MLEGLEMGDCCGDGPEIGFSQCADGLEIVGLSILMGQICSLLQQYVLPCDSML